VNAASAETDRLVRLAQDLLVLARTRRGRVPLAPIEVELGELLAQTAEPFATPPGAERSAVEVVAFEGNVRVDPVRVRQAVQNLLDNAVRHGRGPITVKAERVGGVVRIEVSDSGPGFPPELLDRVFDPFTRGPSGPSSGQPGPSGPSSGQPGPSGPSSGQPGPSGPVDGEPGAGLGLAIVKAVAEAHGGHVTAENTKLGGARVVVVLTRYDRGPATSNSP